MIPNLENEDHDESNVHYQPMDLLFIHLIKTKVFYRYYFINIFINL
jgi:hypothetical protein